jgi:2-phosphoglycerate kinase
VIAGEIRKNHAVSVVSTDALGAVLEEVLTPEAAPDLFVLSRFAELPWAERTKLIIEDPAAHMERVRRESHVVWIAVEAFLRRENREGRDVLIEGAAVLPELIGQIKDVPRRVVFLGNQGREHGQNIKRSAEEIGDDWLRGAGDQYLDAFAVFVNQMSAYIEQEAVKYGFKYVEMDGLSLPDATRAVAGLLGLGSG